MSGQSLAAVFIQTRMAVCTVQCVYFTSVMRKSNADSVTLLMNLVWEHEAVAPIASITAVKQKCLYCVPEMVHHALVPLLIAVLACPAPAVSGLFEWLRRAETGSPPPAAAPPPASAAPTLLAKEAQFEMVTADEKFLAQAKQMEISPLDSCHYRVCFRIHLQLIYWAAVKNDDKFGGGVMPVRQ